MTRIGSRRIFYVLSLGALASPAGVGLIRASQTNWTDLRYLWMAAVAIVVSIRLRRVWAKYGTTTQVVWALVVVTICVLGTAWALGARNLIGIGLVSVSYGLACAGWFAFAARAEPVSPAQP